MLGHQWWWEFDYPEQGIVTANELHIPTGRPVYLTLCAVGLRLRGVQRPSRRRASVSPGRRKGPSRPALGAAVIHSFWLPELAGTQDVVPGQTNHMRIQADEPGTYQGQCKEFCGLSHGDMRFTVVAHTPEDFAAWVAGQQARGRPPEPGSDAAAGLEVFLEHRETADAPTATRSRACEDPRTGSAPRQRRPEPHALHEPDVFRGLHPGDQRREPATMARRPGRGEGRRRGCRTTT